ncbi:MAG: hypothetical protein ACXVEC_03800 [Nocardioides sp.]
MEIVTAPYQPAPSPWSRLLVGVAVLAPVTLLALLPIGLGLERYVVTTDAMSPAIERGTVLLERSVPVGDLRVGDVITFVPPAASGAEGAVTRRIVARDDSRLVTKGDANDAVDPWSLPAGGVSQERVVLAVPKVGFVYLALVHQAVWATLTLGLLALLVLSVAATRRRSGSEARSRQVQA